jgi:1-deoxy-D-xylulose-5-phosphate synthase
MPDLLSQINSPEDLKQLPAEQLEPLAEEIRQYILDVISKSSGHFASSLGAVELTLALHTVFDTPRDKLVWDVGHQAYVHKIVTGRREQFPTIRQKDGLSGYLRRDESEYDAFGAGHASTSISAALGFATARDIQGEDHKVVAIIGDGSMTGGMPWEAINNAGAVGTDVTVILNDNRMSISPNVGAFSKYFNDIISNETYNRIKDDIWNALGKVPAVGKIVREMVGQLDAAVKSLLVPGVVFDRLGMRYFGPVDGHNVHELIRIMRDLKELKGPKLLHVYTQKGKGIPYAEEDPYTWHAGGGFDPESGDATGSSGGGSIKYQDVFGKTMTMLAPKYPKLVAITAAMASGCGLQPFADAYPKQFFDVGIAEQHAVTFAAGLACEGIKPVCAIYSTFLQRAFDQIIHDVSIQNLNVAFAMDRAGLVGDDGATHNGILDLTYLRQIPNMVVMAPKDEPELQRMVLTEILYDGGPIALRYPRGGGPGAPLLESVDDIQPLEIGTWEQLQSGTNVAILAVGSMVQSALEAAEVLTAEGISVEVVNARFVKPLDENMLDDLITRHSKWLTIEENVVAGGFGAAVLESLQRRNSDAADAIQVRLMGVPDRFTEHGTRTEVLTDAGLTVADIVDTVKSRVLKRS